MQSLPNLLPNAPGAAELAFQACIQAAEALGWLRKKNFSDAEYRILRLKSEERAAELRQEISDASQRPSLAALRHKVKECIFFKEDFQAFEKDRRWFLKNRDCRFRVRFALPHETEPHSNTYCSIAIVLREPDGQGEDHPVLVIVTHVNHQVDWTDDTEIERAIDWSGREIAGLH